MKMKRLLSSITLLVFCVTIGFCGINKTLNAAQSLYQTATTISQYQNAKQKFQSAKSDVGYVAAEHDKAISEGIRKCDKKINELSPRLTVNGSSSSTNISFSASGGTQTLSISTNQGSPTASSLPSWITISNSSSSSMTITCAANSNSSTRNDWFQVNAGGKSVRVNVSQSAGRVATLNITGVRFSNTTKDRTVINNFGSTLYASDIRYLTPEITYNGPSSSQTKTIYVKLIKPDGNTMTGSSSPSGYTYSQEVTFYPGDNKTLGLVGWGNESSSSYINGTYKIEIYAGGTKLFSGSVYLNKKSGESSYLTVDNKTAVSTSFSGSGGNETFHVSTDADSWTTWGIPSFCEVTNKTATSFTLKCSPNNTGSERSDYMKVKAGNHEVRIDIKQPSGSGAKINRIWVDHNTFNGGQKGMMIHIDFEVNGLKNHTINPVAYFYYSNGNRLNDYDGYYRTTDGQVSIGDTSNADYEGTQWKDFKLFMPYNQLHMGTGNYDLKFQIEIHDKTSGKSLLRSDYQGFTFSR